jgi:hypothetical protein
MIIPSHFSNEQMDDLVGVIPFVAMPFRSANYPKAQWPGSIQPARG